MRSGKLKTDKDNVSLTGYTVLLAILVFAVISAIAFASG